MTYWPTRFPFAQKPTDLDPEDELRSDLSPLKPGYALTCHPDQLEAEGFGRQDIQRYIAWKKGQVQITDQEELISMNRLGQLIVLDAP